MVLQGQMRVKPETHNLMDFTGYHKIVIILIAHISSVQAALVGFSNRFPVSRNFMSEKGSNPG